MKKYILLLGDIINADPLKENYTTEILSVDLVVESNDIHELERMGANYLAEGGNSYKVLNTAHDHEGVVWTNKAHNQYAECVKIESVYSPQSMN